MLDETLEWLAPADQGVDALRSCSFEVVTARRAFAEKP
jgi:hypothetical protein